MSRDWRIAVSAISTLSIIGGIAAMVRHDAQPPAIAEPPRKAIVIAPPPIELPPSEPSSAVPTLTEAATKKIDKRIKALAGELQKMWTSDPEDRLAFSHTAPGHRPRRNERQDSRRFRSGCGRPGAGDTDRLPRGAMPR